MSLAQDIEPQPEHFGFYTKPSKKKSLYETANQLMKELESIGAIKWHTSTYGSMYIKFKDVRLGSIRISDHKGRKQYNYTYELTNTDTIETVNNIIKRIKEKSQVLSNFDPEKYIVYSPKQRCYLEVSDYETYKDYILNSKDY